VKRKAFLIANNGDLKGTILDVELVRSFLTSPRGGHWRQDEIDYLINPSKDDLIVKLAMAKVDNYDFVIVHFSGHGGQAVNSLILEINPKEETISSSILFNLAKRQVSIFDCCRVGDTPALESLAFDSVTEAYKDTRATYDRMIMNAAEQQLKLYGCASNEVSSEDEDGGYYTQALFRTAMSSSEPFLTFNKAHETAAALVRRRSNLTQNPEIVSGRHLSSQNLVMAVS